MFRFVFEHRVTILDSPLRAEDPDCFVKPLNSRGLELAEPGSRSARILTGFLRGASMGSLFSDLRFAFRQLRKSPGFTATAIAMLAFGIGATTAIFSIVEGVLLRPLPFPDSERLVVLADRLQGADVGGNGEAGVTAPDIRAYTARYPLVHQPRRLWLCIVRAFRHRRTCSGKCLAPHQWRPPRPCGRSSAWPCFHCPGRGSGAALALLSYATWQNRFHGNPQVLGSKILLDRKPYVVIG